ncbi:hypothetical protein B0A55_03116 [Friedmanniomyces simplex]|uniref:Uncharacterized protein n=1 Tax=Friedmanniomyces simplex TaxID=329884 RepID=A0A4U0XKG9_9PEZI|nr:hypothetical protein B0A55_03116 [Friedmanniomyces simplex]
MTSLIKPVMLSPTAITGALLYTVTLAPPSIKDPILQTLRQYVSPTSISRAVIALQGLFALGLLRRLNKFLSELAQNSFRWSSERSRYDWPNEIAVVTGAASGFGRLLAIGLASHGIKVMALDLAPALPADMQSDKRIAYYQCDVTDPDAVNDVASRIVAEHGNPSILINNAGISLTSKLVDTKPKDVQKIFGVNVFSHYYTVAAFVPAIIAQKKGHVITIASMTSFVAFSPLVAYSSTKAAVLSFHEGLTTEMHQAAPEVKTTLVHPTWSATGMIKGRQADTIKKSGADVMDPQIVSDAIVKQILSGRDKQVIVAPGAEWLSTLRAWPHWISRPLINASGRLDQLSG